MSDQISLRVPRDMHADLRRAMDVRATSLTGLYRWAQPRWVEAGMPLRGARPSRGASGVGTCVQVPSLEWIGRVAAEQCVTRATVVRAVLLHAIRCACEGASPEAAGA